MRRKSIKYIIIFIFFLFTILGYIVIQENRNMKLTIGSNYQNLISNTHFLLGQTSTDFWINELENKDNERLLITFIANIEYTARELERNKLGTVGHHMHLLAMNYNKLRDAIKVNGDTAAIEESIHREIDFLLDRVNSITDELGEDTFKWFKEIYNNSSKLQKRLIKEFNERNYVGK